MPTEFFNGEGADQLDNVDVPNVEVQISIEQFQELEMQVYPCELSTDYGIGLYMRTLQYLFLQNIIVR